MPKTRRTQLLEGQTKGQTASNRGTRTKKDAKTFAQEEEKENLGRQTTVSRQHNRSGVLGTTTTLGSSAKPNSKGVKKRKASQLKEKKLPLQDITSQFLPAPESANRGAGSEVGAHVTPIEELPYSTTRRAILLTSPLPPSSPPVDLVFSPVRPPHIEPIQLEASAHDLGDQLDHPLDDSENERRSSSSSDPFGFAALERRLREERKYVLDTRLDVDDGDYEELQYIPVADTSSPRPVPRNTFARKSTTPLDQSFEDEFGAHTFPTPATPRKDMNVQRRLSCEGQDIFSPCSSFLESSPSPTKTFATKRRRDPLYRDPLEEFNTTVDEIDDAPTTTSKPRSKRQCQVPQKKSNEPLGTITWNLRPRRPAVEKAKPIPKPPKEISKAKSNRKAKSKKEDKDEVIQCQLAVKRS